jgi:hypothetical protein
LSLLAFLFTFSFTQPTKRLHLSLPAPSPQLMLGTAYPGTRVVNMGGTGPPPPMGATAPPPRDTPPGMTLFVKVGLVPSYLHI